MARQRLPFGVVIGGGYGVGLRGGEVGWGGGWGLAGIVGNG